MGEDRLGYARRRLAAGSRLRQPEQGDALAAAHEQLGGGQHQQRGAVALGRRCEVAAEVHRLREIRPQPYGMRRFPLALADVEMIGARRAAPVDLAQRVARLELAELPERLARAGAPAAVQAVRDSLRDTLRVDEDFRQAVGEAVRFAFERQDPGTLGRIRRECAPFAISTPPPPRGAR